MAFDMATAKPIQGSTGFDVSTAKPIDEPTIDKTPIPTVEGLARAGGQGATLGFGDEIVAAIQSYLGGVGLPMQGEQEIRARFGEALESERSKISQFKEEQPVKAIGAEIAGGLITGGAGGAKVAGAKVLQQAPKIVRAAVAGSVPGAIAGAGLGDVVGDEDKSLVEESGKGALLGAGLGAGIQAAAPVVAKLARPVIDKIKVKLGQNLNFIDQATGLPAPSFSSALKSRGLEFGDVIDDIDNLPVISAKKTAPEVVDDIIKNQIKAGSKTKGLAGLKLEGDKIVKDSLGDEAIRQGFRPGDVQASKQASPATRGEMSKMLNMQRSILSDTSKATKFRPSDVAGDHVLNRFKFIRSEADKLRDQLNSVANRSAETSNKLIGKAGVGPGLKGLKIDSAEIEKNALGKLEELRVSVSGSPPKLDFTGSKISKDRTSQRIVKDVVDLLSEPGSDGLRAHQLKQQLDTLIDFSKRSPAGLTKEGKKFAKSIRTSLNDSIRDVSPEYAGINDKLSNALESMGEFKAVLGGQIDLEASGAGKAIGQDLRGLLSKRKSRVRLENSVNEINSTAKKLGGKFDIDINDLVQFQNTLDDKFGGVARTAFKEEIQSGVGQAFKGTTGIRDFLEQKIGEKAQQFSGINDDKAFDAMSRILKRGNK